MVINTLTPNKGWSGTVSETRFKNNGESLNIQLYNLNLIVLNKNENFYQVSLNSKKINEEKYVKEFGNLLILPDGSIKGQDANGLIDGRITEKNNKKIMEIYYRSITKSDSMVSYYGELELT